MEKAMHLMRLAELLVVCAACAGVAGRACAQGAPVYTPDGRLERPAQYRDWIFLSSGLDMSYNPAAMAMGHSMFDNVFAEAGAYRAFLQTGHWPDKTILVTEMREAADKASINRHGHFQAGSVMALEVHVRDTARFAGGWGFFGFESDAPATLIPASADCYACHRAHAAVDTTFVQFYPTLLPVAERFKTLSDAYLRER
jgi:hypothetical protein